MLHLSACGHSPVKVLHTLMIHVLGSINIDYAVTLQQLPGPGETITGRDLVLTPGGKGANQALAARRAGAAVKMTGATGTDSVAGTAVSLLKEDGVDLSAVTSVPGPTGCAFVFVDEKSENQIVIIAGANGAVGTAQAQAMKIDQNSILLLQLECPVDTVAAAAHHAKQSGAQTVANLAPYQSLDKQIFNDIDYLILNESEATQLAADLHLQSASVTDISHATGCAVVRTLGARGLEAIDSKSRCYNLPGIKVDAVDTVGAGDTFTGFLGAMLLADNSLQNACKVANAAAALACTKAGAQTAIPTMRDVINLANSAGEN